MKLSELMGAPARDELEELPYQGSELADPPITITEARAVDLGRDTTVCRWHRGQFTHLCVDGKVYFCAVGCQFFRHSEQPRDFLKPLRYPKGDV